RDTLTLQSERIPAAVEGFVMGFDGLGHALDFRNRPEHFRPYLRMGLDHREFILRKCARLIQDSIGDEQLTQVMHPPREDYVFHLLRGEVESAGDDPGIVSALLAVP